MADYCVKCGIPLRIGSQSDYCSEHGGAPQKQESQHDKYLRELKERKDASLAAVYGFDQLVGQQDCVERLKRFGELYAARKEAPEHILITGNDGTGKCTFARAFAKTFNTAIVEKEAREFEREFDLSRVITGLEAGEALLVLNLQELRKPIAEMLRSGLQRLQIDVVIGQGSGRRVHPFLANRFTFLATASKTADVLPDLLRCFSLSLTIQPYSNEELKQITSAIATRLEITLAEKAVEMLIDASERSPGSIENLLRRFARLGGKATITEELAAEVFAAFGLGLRSPSTGVKAGQLDSLSGIEFEKLIVGLLQRMGFRAEMTRTTGDGGVDIVAHLDKPIIGGRYLIQCKRFGSVVGAPVAREFYGAVVADRIAVKGILITTSSFTEQAHDFARTLSLELIDGERLRGLLIDHEMI